MRLHYCLLLGLALWASPAQAAGVTTIKGMTLDGKLIGLNNRELAFRTATEETTLPITEILSLELAASTPPPQGSKWTAVELIDGSSFACSKVEFKGKLILATLLTPDGATKAAVRIEIPIGVVRYLLNEAHDPAVVQEWRTTFLPVRRTEDLLVVKKDGVSQPLDGTIGASDEAGEKLEFQRGGKDYQFPLKRLHGMLLLNKPAADMPSQLCRMVDLFRNSLVAKSVELKDEVLIVDTLAGVRVEYPVSLVARLDYSSEKLAYLSDLQPVKLVEKSSLERVGSYRRDKNLDDGPLRLGNKVFAKGLAMYAYTELTYDIDGKYKEFKATLGVDDNVGGEGRVIVRIDGDGKELFSGAIARKDEPKALALDIKGVRFLRIVVKSEDLIDLGHHVDLADAQVSK